MYGSANHSWVVLVVKYLDVQNTPVSDLEGDVNVESDCEENSPGVEKEARKAKDEEGGETHAVFITGSFSAYAHFYPLSFSRELTGHSAGNHFFSTYAQAPSCSLLSNLRVSTLARITFAKRPWQRHPLPVRPR